VSAAAREWNTAEARSVTPRLTCGAA
jgi:hypothetical protein